MIKSARFTSYFYYLFLPTHLLTIIFAYYTYTTGFYIAVTAVAWLILGPLGLGVGYHRMMAHESIRVAPSVRRFLILLGSLSGQGTPRDFFLVHRHHHKNTDRHEDLQSPIHGFLNSYFFWKLYKPGKLQISKKDISLSLKDKDIASFTKNYYSRFWLLVALVACVDLKLSMAALIVPSVLIFHEISLVDYLCHLPHKGYRNFETHDSSNNRALLGLFTFGLAYHNNHHAHPSSPCFAMRASEIDLGGKAAMWIEKRFPLQNKISQ